jgi:hypothetical protein
MMRRPDTLFSDFGMWSSMKLVQITVLVLLTVAGLWLAQQQTAQAQGLSVRLGFTCSAGKASLSLAWDGADRAGSEIFIDLGSEPDLPSGTFQTRTVPPNTANYLWAGLDAGVTYYLRLNQQSGGQWSPSSIYTLKTPCTGVAAPAGASLKVVAFSEEFVARGGGLPSK